MKEEKRLLTRFIGKGRKGNFDRYNKIFCNARRKARKDFPDLLVFLERGKWLFDLCDVEIKVHCRECGKTKTIIIGKECWGETFLQSIYEIYFYGIPCGKCLDKIEKNEKKSI